MAALPAVIALAGAAVQTVGALKNAQSEEAARNYNAQQGEANAQAALNQGYEEERRQRVMQRKELGQARAQYGASGVSLEGSPLDVLEESAANMEMDALTTRYNAERRASAYRSGASLDFAAANNARSSGDLSATGSVLSGVGQAYGYGVGNVNRPTRTN